MYEKPMKNTALGPPKPSPDAPRSLQNRAQAPLGQHLAARRHPRASKRRPRSAQEAPKSVQETPKNAQEPSKRCLGGPQTLTKSSQGAPKTRFWHVLREKVHSKGTRSDFSSFFGWCGTRAKCLKHRKNLGKTVVFTHSDVFRIASVRARKTFQKCTSESSKTLPRASQTPPKSSPERPKTHKNRLIATTNAARGAKCAQEAPKSEKLSQK